MKRATSELFSPYRSLGVVCTEVTPTVRTTFIGKKSSLSLVCAIDNVLLNYNASKLRPIAMSEPLKTKITAVASTSRCVYAACDDSIALLPFCRDIQKYIPIEHKITKMLVLGTQLVACDEKNGILVIDVETEEKVLYVEGSEDFQITALVHPSTYLNKILIGSSDGRMRIFNFHTGKVIHEFNKKWNSRINVLQQSTAIDIIAVGLANGQILVMNVKTDEVLFNFRHDSGISAIGFRDDGEASMVSVDDKGSMAVWNLEKEELIGKVLNIHKAAVQLLHFVPGEPVMITTSTDNSMRTWIFDGADGMPRQLVILEGHSEPVTSLTFASKTQILSAGLDGTVRKYDATSVTMRSKLGTAATMSKADARKKNVDFESVKLAPVVEMAIGWTREAAWDNSQLGQLAKDSVGTCKLQHERFKANEALIGTTATSICLCPSGNFAYIGYSSGHIDKFNVQSGRHVHTYTEESGGAKKAKHKNLKKKQNAQKRVTAHDDSVTGLTLDQRGAELCSASSSGVLKFWTTKTGAFTKMKSCNVNSLIAVSCEANDGKASVAILDSLTHKIVRFFKQVGPAIHALEFSSDGKWILIADNVNYIRVFDLATSDLIDVLLFSKPCVGISFNPTGEYMATIHEGEKAMFVWANKAMFATHVNIRSLALDYTPTWEQDLGSSVDAFNKVYIDFDEDEMMEEEARRLRELQIDPSLVTYSGLAISRWANLPDLSLIKERNKPTEAPRKAKQTPFFLTAAATLEGFEFFGPEKENENEDRLKLQAKRSLLEMESSFSAILKKATLIEHLIEAFEKLKTKSVSAIDFEIRNLSPRVLPLFLRMLLEVLKTRRDFELVQAYLATALKIHRREFWANDSNEEMSSALEELAAEQTAAWREYESLLLHDTAVVLWVKNALL
ncbi:unnamed protein product [Caenorhabditis auriculariae]|uniref:Small-subunit processome Utp21 domain-containing protein n=1 Tax=Caenorhabditis auriculariae TaxID=2777116 RepID=A0A8S1HK48_9PELO|nr:unnamed protein product [Caenorhabditis auriculariae]